MNIKQIKTADIHESEFNPRIRLTPDMKEYQDIKESIEKFGFIEPIVVNEVNMCCLGGHQRLTVLKDMNFKKIECVLVHIEDEQREKALCVALNKIKGEWDMESLAELLTDEEMSVFPTGFADGEVDLSEYLHDVDLTEDLPEEEPIEIEEEEDQSTVKTIIKIGSNQIVVSAEQYYEMIDRIRDKGIFDQSGIIEELKRRLLDGSTFDGEEADADDQTDTD